MHQYAVFYGDGDTRIVTAVSIEAARRMVARMMREGIIPQADIVGCVMAQSPTTKDSK